METLLKSVPAVFQEAPPGRIRHVYLASSGQAGARGLVRQSVNLGLPLWRGTKDRAWLEKVSVVIDVKDSTRARVKRSRRLGASGGIVGMLGGQVDVLLLGDVFELLPGRYTVTALIDDDDGKMHGSLTFPIEVRNFSRPGGLLVSDVELVLASDARKTAASFERYGQGYVSNPLCLTGDGRELDVFYEIYGLTVPDSLSTHETRYTVLPRQYVLAYERLVREGKAESKDLVAFAADEMASGGKNLSSANYVDVSFPPASLPVEKGRARKGTRVIVSALSPGEYAFILTVTDSFTGGTASARTFFRILNDEQEKELIAYAGRN